MKFLSRSPRTAGAAGTVAASMVWIASQNGRAPGGDFSPLPAPRTSGSVLAAPCLDRLVELQLATVDRVDAVVGERRVAVLVDRVGAEHTLAVLRLEERLEHVLLLAGLGTLDGVQGEAHRLIAVDGVRVGVLVAVLLLEVREEL